MRRRVIAMLWLVLAGSPAMAAAPPQGQPVHPQAKHEDEPNQMPIQVYYHRSFFSQPWRLPQSSGRIARAAGEIAALDGVLLALLAWGRVRRFRRRDGDRPT